MPERLYCQDCGAVVRETDTRCPGCHQSIDWGSLDEETEEDEEDEEDDAPYYCQTCGAGVAIGQDQCAGCGGSIDWADAPEAFAYPPLDPAFEPLPVSPSPTRLGASLMSSDAVVRLACPSCGGMLPLPTAGAEYLLCPFCASSLQLRQTATGFSLALADAIGARVGDQVDQRLLRQQVSMHRIQAEQAQALGHTRAAVLNWTAALELDPHFAPALAWLDGFIGRYAGALTTPMVRELRDLGPAEQDALRILNGNPQLGRTSSLVPPAILPPLGRVSMALLRRIAPRRAAAVEAIHAERLAAYATQRTQYDDTRARQNADREQQQHRWQQQDAAIRRKRPVMARLCLAVTEAETRLQAEAAQRAAAAQAAAQQQQLAAMQQQLREINNRQRKR